MSEEAIKIKMEALKELQEKIQAEKRELVAERKTLKDEIASWNERLPKYAEIQILAEEKEKGLLAKEKSLASLENLLDERARELNSDIELIIDVKENLDNLKEQARNTAELIKEEASKEAALILKAAENKEKLLEKLEKSLNTSVESIIRERELNRQEKLESDTAKGKAEDAIIALEAKKASLENKEKELQSREKIVESTGIYQSYWGGILEQRQKDLLFITNNDEIKESLDKIAEIINNKKLKK